MAGRVKLSCLQRQLQIGERLYRTCDCHWGQSVLRRPADTELLRRHERARALEGTFTG